MGGPGSGNWYRWNSKTTIEETRRIDIRFLKKRGYLQPGTHYTLSWNVGGEPSGFISASTFDDYLELRYRFREYGDDWEDIRQKIWFERTKCNYGGYRKWFCCPGCEQRVAVLSGYGKYFYCRRCYELPYTSQQKGDMDRLIDKKHKLGRRIFEDYDGDGGYKKKGMHWKTFNRLYDEYCDLDNCITCGLLSRFGL